MMPPTMVSHQRVRNTLFTNIVHAMLAHLRVRSGNIIWWIGTCS